VLRVNGIFPKTDQYVLLQVSGLKMPGAVQRYGISVALFDSANVKLAESSANAFYVDTTPGNIWATINAIGSQVPGEYTDLQM
jgi:hypothetical protein